MPCASVSTSHIAEPLDHIRIRHMHISELIKKEGKLTCLNKNNQTTFKNKIIRRTPAKVYILNLKVNIRRKVHKGVNWRSVYEEEHKATSLERLIILNNNTPDSQKLYSYETVTYYQKNIHLLVSLTCFSLTL